MHERKKKTSGEVNLRQNAEQTKQGILVNSRIKMEQKAYHEMEQDKNGNITACEKGMSKVSEMGRV